MEKVSILQGKENAMCEEIKKIKWEYAEKKMCENYWRNIQM